MRQTCDVVRRGFLLSAAFILALTGFAKIWSAFGDVKLLTVTDPIVGIPFKYLMLAVGTAELAIAAVCFFSKASRLGTVLVACMATNFLVYRIGCGG